MNPKHELRSKSITPKKRLFQHSASMNMNQICQSIDANGVATIEINRPDKRNAFDKSVVLELTQAFTEVSQSTSARIVVLRGAGPVFCSGGDIHWMRQVADSDFEQRHAAAELIIKLMHTVYTCPFPTIAAVQGAAFGGGVGLLACCDFVHTTKSLKWATNRGELGVIPACIAPFIIERLGRTKTIQLLLHAQQMTASEGLAIGLIDEIHEDIQAMNSRISAVQNELLQASPEVQRGAKEFIRKVHSTELASLSSLAATTMANSWASSDCKKDMLAFVEKVPHA